jgi:hypothetical protein
MASERHEVKPRARREPLVGRARKYGSVLAVFAVGVLTGVIASKPPSGTRARRVVISAPAGEGRPTEPLDPGNVPQAQGRSRVAPPRPASACAVVRSGPKS